MIIFSLTVRQLFKLLGVVFWALVLCGVIALAFGIGWGVLALIIGTFFVTAVWRVLRDQD